MQVQVQIYRKLLQWKMKSRMVLQLHDALYLSVAPDEVQAFEILVKQAIERLFSLLGTPYTVCMVVYIKVRAANAKPIQVAPDCSAYWEETAAHRLVEKIMSTAGRSFHGPKVDFSDWQ